MSIKIPAGEQSAPDKIATGGLLYVGQGLPDLRGRPVVHSCKSSAPTPALVFAISCKPLLTTLQT